MAMINSVDDLAAVIDERVKVIDYDTRVYVRAADYMRSAAMAPTGWHRWNSLHAALQTLAYGLRGSLNKVLSMDDVMPTPWLVSNWDTHGCGTRNDLRHPPRRRCHGPMPTAR